MKPHRSSEKVNGLLAKCQGSQNGHFFVSFLKSDLNFVHFSLQHFDEISTVTRWAEINFLIGVFKHFINIIRDHRKA